MKSPLPVCLITILLAVAGCQTTEPGPEVAHPLENKVWNLVELHGEAPPPVAELDTPSLLLDHQTRWAVGSSGVNRYTGSYRLEGNSIQFGKLIGTRSEGNPDAVAFENDCRAAFEQVESWRISGTRLELHGSEGVLAVFTSKAYPIQRSRVATAETKSD